MLFSLQAERADASITCYTCGLRSLCPLPYEVAGPKEEGESSGDVIQEDVVVEDNGNSNARAVIEKISCHDACIKFDGYADDGKRVIVRGCDLEEMNLETNTCNDKYDWFGAKGKMCTCNASKCNSASTLNCCVLASVLPSIVIIMVLLNSRRR